jgi:hypothetical protein
MVFELSLTGANGYPTVEPIFFDFESDQDDGVYLLGIRLDHRTCFPSAHQQTRAAGSGVQASAAIITPISSPVSVPCRNRASTISWMRDFAHGVRTKASALSRRRAIPMLISSGSNPCSDR